MKKALLALILLSIFACTKSTAQCSFGLANGGNSCTDATFAKSTIQTFKPTCTGLLNTVIATPSANGSLDDLRFSGYAVQVRIRDASGALLGVSNETTDQWYAGATITFTFPCASLVLNSGTTYQLEFRSIPSGTNSDIELYLFCRTTTSTYADGNLIEDGVANTNADIRGWQFNLLPAPLATTATTATQNITGCTVFRDGSNNLIAAVQPGSTNPVSGTTTAKVWVEGTQPAQFVKRHYEITPASGASTATGRVKLFFTQAEFDDFNAVSGVDLPASPTDATGKANLLIDKRPGSSSTGTGLPGTYTGTSTTINPADSNIVWRADLARWEVTSDATGFSGFFVKTQATPLPLRLLDFTGTSEGSRNRIGWHTAAEDPGTRFEVQGSADGRAFETRNTVSGNGRGGSYTQYDEAPTSPVAYYRLKTIEPNGVVSYSATVVVRRQNSSGGVTIAPVPATDVFSVACNNATLLGTTATVTDVQGRVVSRFRVAASITVDVSGWPAGMYIVRLTNGTVLRAEKR